MSISPPTGTSTPALTHANPATYNFRMKRSQWTEMTEIASPALVAATSTEVAEVGAEERQFRDAPDIARAPAAARGSGAAAP
ncbi:hypothetical protein [Streptomyces mirabilis]|uniref:hypothetical protein n=1 Tax=Streptomyces mirabilis TaxID=68239 RepID=UPI003F4C5076